MDKSVSNNIHPEHLRAPASKSHAQRLILAAALSNEETRILNPGTSNDVRAMCNMVESLGATVELQQDEIIVRPHQQHESNMLSAGESGLGFRLMAMICCAVKGEFVIQGEGSLAKRRMDELENILPQMNVNYELNEGYPPLKILSNAKGGSIEINGEDSSQYLSGLLMSLPLLEEDSILNVHNLQSKPYIDLTLSVLKTFGIEVINENYQRFVIRGNQQYISPHSIYVEGDWSGAANWIVLGSIQGELKLSGLKPDSPQGDKAILSAITSFGASYEWLDDNLIVSKSESPKAFRFDATDCPDLFPPLVVLAAAAEGESEITGTNRLTNKESDRATVLTSEFKKLGLEIEVIENVMHIKGTGTLKSASIDSFNDHRIAMAGAIAASLTEHGIIVKDAEAVTKSYPEFWKQFD